MRYLSKKFKQSLCIMSKVAIATNNRCTCTGVWVLFPECSIMVFRERPLYHMKIKGTTHTP
jgi:hypothetical protein